MTSIGFFYGFTLSTRMKIAQVVWDAIHADRRFIIFKSSGVLRSVFAQPPTLRRTVTPLSS